MGIYYIIWILTSVLFVMVVQYLQSLRAQRSRDLLDQVHQVKFSSVDNEIAELIEKTIEKKPIGFFEELEYKLDQSGTGITVNNYMAYTIIAVVGAFMAGLFFTQSLFLSVIVGGIGFFLPNRYVMNKRQKLLTQFSINLKTALARMASQLRAGGSTKQAVLDIAKASDMNPIIRNEFKRAHIDLEYGYTIEEAFYRMYLRTGAEDAKTISVVTKIQRQKGGNLAEILDKIQTTISERSNQRRRLKTLTAQAMGQSNILAGIPIFVYVLLSFLNPGYFSAMTSSVAGQVLILFLFALVFFGWSIMRKMAAPKA